MKILRICVLVVLVSANIFSGCAGPVYRPSPNESARDDYSEKAKSLPSADTERAMPEIHDDIPDEGFSAPRSAAPRIGAEDLPNNSESSDNSLLAAADSLEIQAEKYLVRGQSDLAFASAERALRYSPYDAALWNLLARIQLERGNYGQAEQLSRKSNLLAKNNKRLQAENWRIISRALFKTGRAAEAEKALRTARELEKY